MRNDVSPRLRNKEPSQDAIVELFVVEATEDCPLTFGDKELLLLLAPPPKKIKIVEVPDGKIMRLAFVDFLTGYIDTFT